MPLFQLNHALWLPPVTESLEDGLLAIGGDLSVKRLLEAYKRGIVPGYEGNTPLWWCPEPRFVLFPNESKVSNSMQALIRKNVFRFSINQNFKSVIHYCKTSPRKGQHGTWITGEMEQAYIQMHTNVYAISAETYLNDELVGGLYGIRLGGIFFGESMFSKVSNASKFVFIQLVEYLQKEGVVLIDCQVYTEHLERLGARFIDRESFINTLKNYVN
jgi:leucyl/phenylalanyl-tRNA--protein transferase